MKNKYTRFDINTEPIASEYYKNLIRKFPQLGASSDGIVSHTCHDDRVLEVMYPHNYQNKLKH